MKKLLKNLYVRSGKFLTCVGKHSRHHVFQNTKKFYKALDVSPFAYSRIKVIIFLIWGINALVFLSKDSVIDNNISPEQLSIVSREFFDNNIIADAAGSLDVNIVPYVTGIIIDSGTNIFSPELYTFNSGRAPPEV